MPLVPPLDMIPAMPGQAVGLIMTEINKLLDMIFEKLDAIIEKILKLPDDCGCDDPRIKEIEELLNQAMKLIATLQKIPPAIQKVQIILSAIAAAATAIKAAMLMGPQAMVIIPPLLALLQDMIIANTIAATKQFNVLPDTLQRSIDLMSSKLGGITNRLGQACPGKSFDAPSEVADAIKNIDYSDTIPGYLSGQFGGDSEDSEGGGFPEGSQESRDVDATLGTDFYTEVNVISDTIQQRVELMEQIVSDQQDLLTSLQEAPAQSYNGSGPPNENLGKPGDYYVDTSGKAIHGPKTSSGWPPAVNY
jgi:hypothetical protein